MAPARGTATRPPRRPGGPKSSGPALFAAGVLAGAIAFALFTGWHSRTAPPAARPQSPPHGASSHAARRPAPRPAPPAAAPRRATPRLPERNPENSQSPAVVPAPPAGGTLGSGPETTRPAPAPAGRPRVAVIFDDAGYSLRAAREVMDLPRPVTISILPDLPFSTPIAEEAERRGVQVILHLPVQPDNPGIDIGPGGVTVAMTDGAIARTVAADFATVPGAVGTNNHMGSRGTADPRVMRAVLGVVRARRLFFIDSMTSPRSVAAETAREMGVPTAVRAVFLDNEDTDTYVRAQFHALIRVAQTRGEAIAIGHVGKVTARVLREMLPEFDEADIRFVPVSTLVH
jgi:polysaccharide deacetylase 2 family uncharacterized protein YibQ